MTDNTLGTTGFVVIGGTAGHTVIAKDSPLTRLNYFDGKFLRAPDLKLEQLALLNQVRLANRAGGAGVVYGYDCTLGSGDALNVGAGFAIDPAGRALYLTQQIAIGIAELIEKSRALNILMKQSQASQTGISASFADCEVRAESAPGQVLDPNDLYLITLGHTEAYCGEEDVYGKLCEEACITSTERPYIVEGVILRAIPLSLSTLLPTSALPLSNKHLRSRVASAYFEQERQNGGSLISGEGLASSLWCLGATAALGNDVPIAVIGRAGDATSFLDAWIARRERMESPPRHYWAGRMAMRPWNVFLAQVLQFQCQLTKCLKDGPGVGDGDPCDEERALAKKAAEELRLLMQKYEAIAEALAKTESIAGGVTTLKTLKPIAGLAQAKVLQQDLTAIAQFLPTNRLLINCGIIELPSGGYLPVDKSAMLTVNEQVRRLMGEGVDLRFCVVRPDYIPHALEEAQHMQRISLLEGIDNPANKQRVDVLVPDGRIEEYKPETPGTGYRMRLRLDEIGVAIAKLLFDAALERDSDDGDDNNDDEPERIDFIGAARGERLDSGRFGFYFAARQRVPVRISRFVRDLGRSVRVASSVSNSDVLGRILAEVSMKSKERAKEAGVSESKAESLIELDVIQATQEGQSEDALLWVDLDVDRDLFNLSIGERADVDATLVLVVSHIDDNIPTISVIKLKVGGTLTVDDIVTMGNDVTYKCNMSASGYAHAKETRNGNTDEDTIPLNLSQRVEISKADIGDARPRISVRLPDLRLLDVPPGYQIGFERRWHDFEQATVDAWVIVPRYRMENQSSYQSASRVQYTKQTYSEVSKADDTRLPILAGKQLIDADALKPGDAYHDTSLAALRIIGSALDDRQFADIAARQLFPPPQPVPRELQVFARLDWVMFHRRRDIVCGYEEPPAAEIASRRYRLFHVHLSNVEELKLLAKALVDDSGAVIERFKPEPVTIVEFEAGLSSVRPPHDAVLAPWDTAVVGEAVIMLGAIASRDAAYDEGPALARLRLESLTDVLEPVTDLDEESKLLDPLSRIPGVLPSADVDGVIVMATASVATVCHRVYRVELNSEDVLKEFSGMIGENFKGAIAEYGALPLSKNVEFVDGKPECFGNSKEELVSEWAAAGDKNPWHALLVVRSEGTAAATVPTDQPYAAQTKEIALAVSPNGNFVQSEAFNASAGGDTCVAATVLVVSPEVIGVKYFDVYAVAASTPQNVVKAASNSINFTANDEVEHDAALAETIKLLKESEIQLKTVELVSKEEPAATSDARAEAMLAAFKEAGVAEEGATVKLRKATETELKSLAKLDTSVTSGFVLKK